MSVLPATGIAGAVPATTGATSDAAVPPASDAAGLAQRLASGSWAPGGAAAFQAGFSSPGGTVASMVSWALEYVSPLPEWLARLTGDEARVHAMAQSWRAVAADLTEVRADLDGTSRSIAGLEGRTARALRKRVDDLGAVLGDASAWTSATASALDLASDIVGAVHDAIVGALSELAGLVVDLFGFTLNPFDKVEQLHQLSQRAQGLIRVVGDLIERMTQAFQHLMELLRALEPLIREALTQLRALLGQLVRVASPFVGGVVGAVSGAPFGPLGVLGGGVVGGLLSGVLGGGLSDILATDPRVAELDPDALDRSQRDAWNNAQSVTSLPTLSSLVAQNGFTDAMGRTDRSVVDIKTVIGEDGSTHYVVSLPSTQDWNLIKGPVQGDWSNPLADDPATNDLDSNVALMVMNSPELRTQYERAVLQAMSDAGVPPGAPVVYTGFSQGGIMAASLASHPTPYTTIGIVTNGSPIDGFAIPPGVQVVSFEHDGDVVPKLDLANRPDGVSGDRVTAHLPAPVGPAHDNTAYARSVQAWEAANPAEAQRLSSLLGGTVVDHQMHTWTE